VTQGDSIRKTVQLYSRLSVTEENIHRIMCIWCEETGFGSTVKDYISSSNTWLQVTQIESVSIALKYSSYFLHTVCFVKLHCVQPFLRGAAELVRNRQKRKPLLTQHARIRRAFDKTIHKSVYLTTREKTELRIRDLKRRLVEGRVHHFLYYFDFC
jgi:hypothetical protein